MRHRTLQWMLCGGTFVVFAALIGPLQWESQLLLFDREAHFFDLPPTAPVPELDLRVTELADDRLMVQVLTRV